MLGKRKCYSAAGAAQVCFILAIEVELDIFYGGRPFCGGTDDDAGRKNCIDGTGLSAQAMGSSGRSARPEAVRKMSKGNSALCLKVRYIQEAGVHFAPLAAD